MLGHGLGGAGGALERTAAIRRACWRTAHAVAVAVAVFAVAVASSEASAGFVLRTTAGLVGLTALAATALGHQLAWTLPTAAAGVAAVVPPQGEPQLMRVLTWSMQPPDSMVGTVVAAVLALGGLTAYAARGSRAPS